MIANMKWRVLALPIGFVALGASIDCSNNSSGTLCPEVQSAIQAGGDCANEAFVCPYTGDSFDQSRTDSTSDCFGNFIEFTCTQKKWVVTAQAPVATCSLDASGTLTPGSGSTTCSLGVGRCAIPAGTALCQSSCSLGPTSYSATCTGGQFVVTNVSCTQPAFDAGTPVDAGVDDASTDDAASDAGDD